MDDEFVKNLVSNVKCRRCGLPYEPGNTHLLAYRHDLWLLSVYCPSCKSQGLLVAATGKTEWPDVDAELAEAEKSRFSAPISSDDVIDTHMFLKGFGGDFSSLFPER